MRAAWHRIRHILDALINNSFEAGATVVESQIEDGGDRFSIHVKDNGHGMSPEVLKKVGKMLAEPRRREMEEYYGQLAGRTAKNFGLTIVGMMVDDHEISSEKGVGTEITLVVKKP